MLQEQDGIITTNRGPQQAGSVQRVRWKYYTQPGDMGKSAFATLRVINRATGKVAADRDADDQRRGESIVRAPANHRQFVAQLHHGGPDVIEELNFDHRLKSAGRHAGCAADDIGLGQRRIENAV